jgi:hypothetical protein
MADTMTFGGALDLLVGGYGVSRRGWNGKGMYVAYVPESIIPVEGHLGFSEVKVNAYFTIMNTDRTLSTWVPSIRDCLADDWYIVEV